MTQIRADALDSLLARGLLPPAIWIHGDEPLLVQEAAQSVRAAARAAGFDERIAFEVDRSFRPDAVAAEANALSLFGSSKLLELRFAAKPGKEVGQAIADIAQGLPDTVRLLAVSPRLDRATTESAWFSAIDRCGATVAIWPVERGELPRWIAGRLARQKQRADAQTLELIAERVEGNLLAAHQEIAKLGLLFPEGALPPDEARAAVLNVARYDAFDLVDAMLAGDAARALRSLDGLRAEGEAETLIVWAIAESLRTLWKLLDARDAGRPPAQAMRELRIFGARERAYGAALRRADRALLRGALRQAAQADRIVKGVAAGDAWHALETLVVSVAGGPALAEN